MIVYEYEGGRRGHQYVGRMASKGFGVTLYPVRGGYNTDSRQPYEKKYTNILKMVRLPDHDAPTPIESAPTRAVERTSPAPEPPEYVDNSRYTGVQIKLI